MAKEHSEEYWIAIGVASACAITTPWLYIRHYRRIRNADYLTPRHFHKRLQGKVTRVGDGDNFRVYHTPLLHSLVRRVPVTRKDLKDETIHVRIAGVDAPELAHFGHPEQPYAKDALQYLKSLVDQRKVTIEPLSKDQYGRIVSHVWVRRFPYLWTTLVSKAMLDAGYATVYRQQHAQYGKFLPQFERCEARARKKRIGMWSQGKESYESPGDFKARHRSSS